MEIPTTILITLYIILLGPLKVIVPFARTTANADRGLRRQIATRAAALSTVVSLVIAGLGGYVMSRFNLSVGVLTITMGFFMGHWAVRNALAQPVQGSPSPDQPTTALAIFPVSIPMIIPPQGIALLVLSTDLLIETQFLDGPLFVAKLILAVMGLNWLFMLAAQSLMKFPGLAFWGIVGRIVAVIISAMALQIIFSGFRGLGLLP